MKYEKKVALFALRKMHSEHLNFSKTLLKNMNSYLHTSALTDEWFKKLVEILPLSTEHMTMEILEIYLAILNKIANEVLLHAQKKSTSIKKRRRVPIMKIVLTSFLECAINYPILRDYVFSTVFSFCKKTIESKMELSSILNNFLGIYLCKFAGSLDERCFKMSLDLFYTHSQDEKKLLRLLYIIHANFPTFFDGSRAIAYLKDKIKQIKYENFDPQYISNCELYRIETFVEDLEFINKNYPGIKREHEKLRNYLIFVNIFCYKKKVVGHHAVSASSCKP
jgi:ATP-dependent Lon protease